MANSIKYISTLYNDSPWTKMFPKANLLKMKCLASLNLKCQVLGFFKQFSARPIESNTLASFHLKVGQYEKDHGMMWTISYTLKRLHNKILKSPQKII